MQSLLVLAILELFKDMNRGDDYCLCFHLSIPLIIPLIATHFNTMHTLTSLVLIPSPTLDMMNILLKARVEHFIKIDTHKLLN